MTGLAAGIGRTATSLAGRFLSAIEWRVYRPLHVRYAAMWRSRLEHVTFVSITGSAGKTSTKEMTTAILESVGSVKRVAGTGNRLFHIAGIIAGTRPSDDFCVLELSAERPGYFDRLLPLVGPRIGVVTAVGDDQYKAFGSREAIAAEKGKLIAALPPDGTAVLNADDPLVRAMGERCKGRIVTFGIAERADLQARDIRAAWPERLSFTARFEGEDYPVQTQLCGRHWVTSVLAALATGVAAGVSLPDAVRAVSTVEPLRARMQPLTTPDGITFLRDDWKASYWGMPTVFDFLREAKAPRKILVCGTLSDYEGTARTKYRDVARQGLEVADAVIFVGNMATLGLRVGKGVSGQKQLRAYPAMRQAAAALQDLLRDGDLVLLKGSGPGDHLSRLYHARLGPVSCWRMDCGKEIYCEFCPQLRCESAKTAVPRDDADAPDDAETPPNDGAQARAAQKVFVGIGNPGAQYHDTPHNVGFAVLDELAQRAGATWERRGDAEIAWLQRDGSSVLLAKPQTYVNNTGKVLQALATSLGFSAEDCVLVQDDIHLPAGVLRTRMNGSDGGHLGVRSAIVAFQSSDIARVKIGVAAGESRLATKDYLLSRFPPSVAEKMTEAYAAAADRLWNWRVG